MSATKGLVLVAAIEPVGEISTENMNCRFRDAYVALTDEFGYINSVSANFKKSFFKKEQFGIDDLKINIEDIVQGINDCSE